MPYVRNIDDNGIMARIRKLETMIEVLAKRNPLRSSSITDGSLKIGENGWVQSYNWDGSSEADPGTVGWALGGPLNTAIINTLVLRDRIVGNGALTSPMSGETKNAAGSQTIITSIADYRPVTFTPPAGFATSYVMATVSMERGAASAAAGNALLSVDIDGQISDALILEPDGTRSVSTSKAHAATVAGTDPFTVAARAVFLGASATAYLSTSAVVIFQR